MTDVRDMALTTCDQLNRDLIELGLVSNPCDDGLSLRDRVRKLLEEGCRLRLLRDRIAGNSDADEGRLWAIEDAKEYR